MLCAEQPSLNTATASATHHRTWFTVTSCSPASAAAATAAALRAASVTSKGSAAARLTQCTLLTWTSTPLWLHQEKWEEVKWTDRGHRGIGEAVGRMVQD